MSKNILFRSNYAVSEVVGGLFLIVIAVLSFTVIQHYLIPDEPRFEENIQLQGSVTSSGVAVIEHVGGESITDYLVIVNDIYGNRISSNEYRNVDPPWKIGECIYPLEDIGYPPLLNVTDGVEIWIISYEENDLQQLVFKGVLSGSYDGANSNSPILISSLRTDTSDEDLICYSYPVIPDINATTYIYKWILNELPFADVIMPFNTDNNDTAKDYSGKNNNAILDGAIWMPDGVLGGCTFYQGSSEYLTMPLPSTFSNIPENNFTISLWIKNCDVTEDRSVIFMASKDGDNFVSIFLSDNKVNVGVCVNKDKDAVSTNVLVNNQWYHIAVVWNSNRKDITVYCDGIPYKSEGYTEYPSGTGSNLLEMGHATASSNFWQGYIDELEIYNKALSHEQIYQLYFSSKDGDYSRRVIVSEETIINQKWQCVVTPNDGIQDGNPVFSNILWIKNYTGGD